jgi:hypothetical protein
MTGVTLFLGIFIMNNKHQNIGTKYFTVIFNYKE